MSPHDVCECSLLLILLCRVDLVVAKESVHEGEAVVVGCVSYQHEWVFQAGAQIVYSKYAGTELEFSGSNHLVLKEDDILGILESSNVKDLQPLDERVLIKVAEAEEKTAGGLLLTEATKETPSVDTIIAVGLGPVMMKATRNHSLWHLGTQSCIPSSI
ncbi:hypothetical protein MLD38_006198 [Melastoma candidum]|uniref:Uncharacterized protein n=1 Tax=Melastoma candidum TaxID=119954 RepID=A0ACB9RLR8_9MYRT|nr:hypothetical protein MLD38_006198 [Melastoma candidum]